MTSSSATVKSYPKLLLLSDNLKRTNPSLYQQLQEEMHAIRELVFASGSVESHCAGGYAQTAYDTTQAQPSRSTSSIEVDLNIEFHQFEKDQKHTLGKDITSVSLVDNTALKDLRRNELHIKLLRMRATGHDRRFEEGQVHCQLKILNSHNKDRQKTIGETEYVEARNTDSFGFVQLNYTLNKFIFVV